MNLANICTGLKCLLYVLHLCSHPLITAFLLEAVAPQLSRSAGTLWSSAQTTPTTAGREAPGHGTEVYLQKIHFAEVAMGTVISTERTDSRDTQSISKPSIVIPWEKGSTQKFPVLFKSVVSDPPVLHRNLTNRDI